MARTPRGKEVLEKAKELLSRARTVEELREAQAVVLPLEYGFSMERTVAIGYPREEMVPYKKDELRYSKVSYNRYGQKK